MRRLEKLGARRRYTGYRVYTPFWLGPVWRRIDLPHLRSRMLTKLVYECDVLDAESHSYRPCYFESWLNTERRKSWSRVPGAYAMRFDSRWLLGDVAGLPEIEFSLEKLLLYLFRAVAAIAKRPDKKQFNGDIFWTFSWPLSTVN